MPDRFGRPVAQSNMLPSFVNEAGRLRNFVPPFRFTSFFSPEDTLLCTIASETALARARTQRRPDGRAPDALRIVELTTGSGLVGLHLLRLERKSRLVALDVDPAAVDTAARNARILGLSSRVRFECDDLWSESTSATLARFAPHVVICNPPYVPEPADGELGLEAGAGPDGTAHLMRTLELADQIKPRALALSWCSLCDPGGIIREAERVGYSLSSLFIVAIADGEYSGSVHDYLRSLPRAFIAEDPETVRAVAPDGSGRFAYLLMAGDFSGDVPPVKGTAAAVERISGDFARNGLRALLDPVAPIPVRTWLLDRWDEVRIRAVVHGDVQSAGPRTA